jgi:hypothetical protein
LTQFTHAIIFLGTLLHPATQSIALPLLPLETYLVLYMSSRSVLSVPSLAHSPF